MRNLLHAWSWLDGYRANDLKRDCAAGATVAVMLVPQAMAYALLAGLPPVAGLYAATFPLMAYALVGTSRQLAVGPVAMISLLAATACGRVAEPGSAAYIQAMALLALLAGAMQILLGWLRAGFLVNFVSHAVISGFTSAVAVVIALSQLKHLLGIELDGGTTAVNVAVRAVRRLPEAHAPTVVLGLGALGALAACRKKWPRFPGALLAVAAGAGLVAGLRLHERGVRTVGFVPRGLPAWDMPVASAQTVLALLPAALVIVFIGYMESNAVSQWIASREKYRVNPNRELLGLGLANLTAGLFSGYAVTGGFSRTAVNYQAGARSPLSSLVTAGLVLLALLALTPLFTLVPYAVLAAVIMVAVAGLFDVREAARLFRLKKADGWTLAVTFAVTLAAGIEEGLLAGIFVSLLLFVARSSRPRTVVLGRVGDRDEFHDIGRRPDAVTCPDVIVIRVDASLYFANARFVEDRVRERLALNPEARWVLMDMSGVNDIDAVAVAVLDDLMEACAHRGVRFAFAGMKAQVRDVAARDGWADKLGAHLDHPGLGPALAALRTGGAASR